MLFFFQEKALTPSLTSSSQPACVTDLSPAELICGQEVYSNLVLTLIKENSEEGALWEKK